MTFDPKRKLQRITRIQIIEAISSCVLAARHLNRVVGNITMADRLHTTANSLREELRSAREYERQLST